jgi:hypothetical protein
MEEHIRDLGIPATFFQAGAYMNLFTQGFFFRPSTEPPRTFTAAFPVSSSAPIFPLFDAEADTGKYVKGILLHRDELLGKRIHNASGWWSLDEIMKKFEEMKPIAGKGAKAIEVPAEAFKDTLRAAHMPEMALHDMVQNLECMTEFGYFNC